MRTAYYAMLTLSGQRFGLFVAECDAKGRPLRTVRWDTVAKRWIDDDRGLRYLTGNESDAVEISRVEAEQLAAKIGADLSKLPAAA